MKKNILLLINGFGIEQADSVNVYNEKLMPNMDRLTKEKLFASLASKDLDYKDGYRKFSIGINESLTYSIVENSLSNDSYKNNQLLKYIESKTNMGENRLHIFCYWENDRTVSQLATFLKEIVLYTNHMIYVHLILCQLSLTVYKSVERSLTFLNYELGNTVKIGIVTGESNLDNILIFRDMIKTFVTEAGEKWKDLTKKVDVLKQTKTIPNCTRTFAVNTGFAINPGDQVFFFNYSNVDVNKFMTELENQKYRQLDTTRIDYYSLFPVKSNKKIPFMYNYAVSSTYTASALKTIGAKCLLIDLKEKCPYINYYLTGLRNNIDENIKYMASDSGFIYEPNQLLQIINTSNCELIIVNYEIDTCKLVDDIANRLSKIDVVIGELDKLVQENKITLFISSLYGIEKEMYNSKHEVGKVNFSVRVPLVVDDYYFNKTSYTLNEGTVYDLANTIYKNINSKYNIDGLIKKKSNLLSFFYKKPKKVKEEKNG